MSEAIGNIDMDKAGEVMKFIQSQNESHRKGHDEKEVEILGGLFEVPPAVAEIINFGYTGWLVPELLEKGGGWISKHGKNALLKSKVSEERASNIAGTGAGIFTWLVLLAEPLKKLYDNVDKYTHARSQLAKELQPAFASHEEKQHRFTVGGYKNNEVVRFELDKIGTEFRKNVSTTLLTGTLNTFPNVVMEQRRKAESKLVKGAEQPTYAVSSKMMSTIVIPGAALISTKFHSSNNNKNERFKGKESAFKLIKELNAEMEDRGAISSFKGKKLADFVEYVFQAHQDNMGRRPIGERYQEDLDFACEEIAKALKTGKMHPLALVDIVGGGMVVKHEGKSIASRAQIQELIGKLSTDMPAHYTVDSDKYLSESTHTLDDLKQLLAPMDQKSRDVLESLIPDEVLKAMGRKDDDIKALHKRTEATLAQDMQAVIFDLASQPDDVLKSYKLKDDEIKFVRKVAEESKVKNSTAAILASVSTFGEFKKGIEWPMVNAKPYWEAIASGKLKIGQMYAEKGNLLDGEAPTEKVAETIKERIERGSEDDIHVKREGESRTHHEKPKTHISHAAAHAKHATAHVAHHVN